MYSPRISFIMPCYNGEAFLEQTLRCALDHDYENKEIIVVDDGSTDGSPGILASFGKQIRVLQKENAGVAAARNDGIALATGEYLQFLDADDLILPGKLNTNMQVIRETGADVVIGDYLNLGGTKRFRPINELSIHQFGNIDEYMMYTIPLVGRGLYRTELVRRVGGFRNFRRGEDHFFHFALLMESARFGVTEGMQFLYRVHREKGRLTGIEAISRHPFEILEKNRAIEALLKEHDRFDEKARGALSFNSYRQALRFFGAGLDDIGNAYLQLAQQYRDPPVVLGSRTYTAMNRILGCRRTAHILQKSTIRRLTNLIRG